MSIETLGGVDYNVYADTAFAAPFLAGDVLRAAAWELVPETGQKRALISATRAIASRVNWKSGAAPGTEDPELPEAISQAAATLAADMAAKPGLAKKPGSASNVKRAKAGPAEVEFFSQPSGEATPLPEDVWSLILSTGLVGSTDCNTGPTYFGADQESRFNL